MKADDQAHGLAASDVRRVYDRIGRAQDWQRFYEDPATARLVADAHFGTARLVVELGCGTGRFAARLLERELAPDARYVGVDLSPTMVRLASERLAPWSDRATVRLAGAGSPPHLPVEDAAADRIVANYVFDLLGDDDTRAALGEAHRALAQGGLLCAAGLTHGERGAARAVSRAWDWIWRRKPVLVGGCRPIELVDALDPACWRVRHRSVVIPWAIASEAVVTERVNPDISPSLPRP